jgi:peptidoglycan lytic transglycosylase G
VSDLGLGTVGPRGQRLRQRRLGGCLAVLLALAIIVGIGIFTYVEGVDAIKGWLHSTSAPDYAGEGHGNVVIQVKEGDTASDIGATLEHFDVVKSAQAFADAAKDNEAGSRSIQVGYYRMHRQMSGANALKLMLDPSSRVSSGITIPEGLRAKEILALVADHSKFTASDMEKAFADTKALGLPTYAKNDAEGYLYPATYPVTPDSTPTSLLTDMTARFAQEAADLNLTAGAAALHISPTDLVTVASLVQAEARRPQDMPKVARVIYNRLQIGMALQLDSTLHYAIDSRGVVQTSDKLRDLDTPYNSYKFPGLPPTPIDSPGELALKAALHPATGTWKYFVTVNLATGKTLFATSYADFLQDKDVYIHYCQNSKAC